MQSLLDRLARQVEAHACPVISRFSAGVVVDLDDDVGLRRYADANAIGQAVGLGSGGPEAQLVGLDACAGGCEVARPRSIQVELAAPAGRIDICDEMVNGGTRALGAKSTAST